VNKYCIDSAPMLLLTLVSARFWRKTGKEGCVVAIPFALD
jgi:hypothetical protein